MGVMRISAHSLTSDVGIGSRSHDLDGEDFRILSSSSVNLTQIDNGRGRYSQLTNFGLFRD